MHVQPVHLLGYAYVRFTVKFINKLWAWFDQLQNIGCTASGALWLRNLKHRGRLYRIIRLCVATCKFFAKYYINLFSNCGCKPLYLFYATLIIFLKLIRRIIHPWCVCSGETYCRRFSLPVVLKVRQEAQLSQIRQCDCCVGQFNQI